MIKSATWCVAGSGYRTQANLTLAIVTFGRTKRDRPKAEDNAAFEERKLKRAVAAARRVWG
jgi:hypothetical protein